MRSHSNATLDAHVAQETTYTSRPGRVSPAEDFLEDFAQESSSGMVKVCTADGFANPTRTTIPPALDKLGRFEKPNGNGLEMDRTNAMANTSAPTGRERPMDKNEPNVHSN
ncbi:hypothetical protein DPMN_120830 [Dreissena polymorpha]|uniref:Uncharacterized protein n=1 Tax=Dreissena polymorpha TaxID=45954 RepID=A0A9D4GLK5_DREPO|nr:hypothetical protein DPMN_120830 [Dreissena polymorpha]